MDKLEVLSTRLFPKGMGANRYQVTGIAARCEWVILSDYASPQVRLLGDTNQQPRTVFLSLRSPFHAIEYFFDSVLPLLSNPFVLISGSEDVTVPHQKDHRWRQFKDHELGCIRQLLSDPRLIHWYAENLDTCHPKMSPLPLGLLPQNGENPCRFEIPVSPPLRSRDQKMLCAHRIRDGSQWEERRLVSALCESHLSEICTRVNQQMSEEEFIAQVESHAFVLCVRGGGLDPSPKAWQAILHGAIPIIRSSALDAAYQHLPVAMVKDWTRDALSREQLTCWFSRLRIFYEDVNLRRMVLNKLSSDYWWAHILLSYYRGTKRMMSSKAH